MQLDPDFGGMRLQILVKIATRGGAIFYGMRRKIKAFFTKDKNTAANGGRQAYTPSEEMVDMLADEGSK
jgi:hypothetical protein